ncbi:hypothetical protein [Mycolicibacterium moriokaense]|uniref:hypothetical protein n=1 Tax=Mycolicibacterium moriokaense TaxID=39691 RepID=UPI0011B508BA|nr:hypothetical protein [Mycolicibacterium moriokaense]
MLKKMVAALAIVSIGLLASPTAHTAPCVDGDTGLTARGDYYICQSGVWVHVIPPGTPRGAQRLPPTIDPTS